MLKASELHSPAGIFQVLSSYQSCRIPNPNDVDHAQNNTTKKRILIREHSHSITQIPRSLLAITKQNRVLTSNVSGAKTSSSVQEELVTMMKSAVVMLATMVLLNMVPVMYAAELHKVGGTLGWNYPPTQGAGYFANWAAQNQFHVGDSLSFEYIVGTHNVVQVDRADYDACTSNRPMQLYSANKVVVNLPNPGTYYYICGIKGHCEYGMKVALTVT